MSMRVLFNDHSVKDIVFRRPKEGGDDYMLSATLSNKETAHVYINQNMITIRYIVDGRLLREKFESLSNYNDVVIIH
jgi:hypothetical protein